MITVSGYILPFFISIIFGQVPTIASREQFDFIVVGAGTAGSFLAHRLATSSSAPSVLLLEAGPNTLSNDTTDAASNPNLNSLIPGFFAENVAQTRVNYMYTTAPQEGLNGRALMYHRGKGLGGTSNLNYMAWLKGYKGDFDEWAQRVDDASYSSEEGWERIKKLESFDPTGLPNVYSEYAQPEMTDHGTTGPIHNSLPKSPIPGMGTFVEACEEAGIPRNLDVNKGEPLGGGLVQMAIWKGARVSSATQLLNEDGDIGAGLIRPRNLEVRVETKVNKILFDGKRAIGVELASGKRYYAGKEVIVSAGFIDSPKLLLLSGVGPKEELEKLGIKVVQDSPNVGKNLLDHTTVLLDPVFKQDLQIATGNALFADPALVELEKQKWLNSYHGGKGEGVGELTRFGGSAAVAFVKFPEDERNAWPEWQALSEDERQRFLDPKRPDTEIFYFMGYLPPGHTISEGAEANSYARLFLLHQNHLSRGSITLNSSDASEQAIINPQYFSHPYDVRVAVETIKMVLKIFRTGTYSHVVEGMEFLAADELPKFIKNTPEEDAANKAKAKNGFYVNGIQESDEGIERWLREKGLDHGYHGMGTCRMGKNGDPLRVVDAAGKVVGIEGLRVADVSVVPVVMNNHPQVSAYLIADVIADRIVEQYGLSEKTDNIFKGHQGLRG
ncbi:hypothetical protein RUND412_007371 [Rhizina undulata]